MEVLSRRVTLSRVSATDARRLRHIPAPCCRNEQARSAGNGNTPAKLASLRRLWHIRLLWPSVLRAAAEIQGEGQSGERRTFERRTVERERKTAQRRAVQTVEGRTFERETVGRGTGSARRSCRTTGRRTVDRAGGAESRARVRGVEDVIRRLHRRRAMGEGTMRAGMDMLEAEDGQTDDARADDGRLRAEDGGAHGGFQRLTGRYSNGGRSRGGRGAQGGRAKDGGAWHGRAHDGRPTRARVPVLADVRGRFDRRGAEDGQLGVEVGGAHGGLQRLTDDGGAEDGERIARSSVRRSRVARSSVRRSRVARSSVRRSRVARSSDAR